MLVSSSRKLVAPVLFLIVGVFWLALVGTGGAPVLLLAALVFILSGIVLLAFPSKWYARPLAGATALFGLTVTLWQFFLATSILGTGLGGVGATSGALFGVLAILCAYLELQTLALGSKPPAPKKA